MPESKGEPAPERPAWLWVVLTVLAVGVAVNVLLTV